MQEKKERLKSYFELLGIDAKLLNKRTNIEISTCYRIVSGETFPNYENLRKIKESFPEISLNYLITGN